MACRAVYENGVWKIYYDGKLIARVYVDEELYSWVGDPWAVDERIVVECVDED